MLDIVLTIIAKGFIIGACVLCIWYTYREGEIFEQVGIWGEQHIPDKWQQPVYECNVCMTPWYGSVIYWLAAFFWGGNIGEWIFTIMVAMALNIVLNKIAPDDVQKFVEVEENSNDN